MFHVNWGWGGSSDGYFAVTNLTTDASHSYLYYHEAILGIEPDTSITREYTIDLAMYSATQNEYGSLSGGGSYVHGSTATISAIPNPGYSFNYWIQGQQLYYDNTISFAVYQDQKFYARFSKNYYTLTTNVNPSTGGIITHNYYTGLNYIGHGHTITLTATPNDGCSFKNWTVNGNIVSTSPNYTMTITSDSSIYANFESTPIIISASANSNTYGTVEGGGSYLLGETVTLTATPNTGYKFIGWSENGSTITNNTTYTFTATSNKTFVANFEIITYTIEAFSKPAAGGTVTGSGNYTHGETVTLTATANPGYTFKDWGSYNEFFGLIHSIHTNTTYTFTATANLSGKKRIYANFEADTYKINATAKPSSNYGTITGEGTYSHGETVNLVATALEGYEFVNWTENNEIISTSNLYSFTATEERDLQANFQIMTHTITVTRVPLSQLIQAGTVEGGGTFNHNELVKLRATPASGYEFMGWSKAIIPFEIISTNTIYGFNATEDAEFVGIFSKATHTITATANPAAGGTVTGGGDFTNGSSVTLNATPATNYTFISWSENGVEVSTDPTYTFPATKDRTLKANFVFKYITINVAANPSNRGTVTGGGTYNLDDIVKVTASPNTGYTFVNWIEDDIAVSTSSSYDFNARANRNLVAHFQPKTSQITVSANPSDGGVVTGGGSYVYPTTANIVASANSNYTFVNWTKNGVQISTNPNYTFTPQVNGAYVANFQLKSHTITASANNTDCGNVSGAGSYSFGDTATLIATPNTNYTFTNWTENGTIVSYEQNYSFRITEDRILIANFVPASYHIELLVDELLSEGNVSGSGDYSYQETVTINATPNQGYKFTYWQYEEESGSTIISTDNPYQFNATADETIYACFKPITFSINASANVPIYGNIFGIGTFNYNDTVTLTATPRTGYKFVGWTENGTEISTSQTLSFIVYENRTFVANFQPITYTITSWANPESYGSTSGSGEYDYYTAVTMEAIENPGYSFLYWSENNVNVSSDNPYTFLATKDRNLVAIYQRDSYTITLLKNTAAGGDIQCDESHWIDGSDYRFHYGETVPLTATNNYGYTFINWTENGNIVSTNSSYSFLATESKTLTANFQINSYTINVNANANGSTSGSGSFDYQTVTTITATPNTHYHFVSWNDGNTDNPRTITVTDDATYTATFAIDQFTITVNAGENGTASGSGTFDYGTQRIISATPSEHYHFVSWIDGNTSNPRTITVTDDATYTATFAIDQFTVTVNAGENGTASGNGTFDYGSQRTITATPNEHYHFVSWNDGNTDNPRTITVTENATYTASFAIDQFTITVNAVENGTTSGSGTFDYGTQRTISATPSEHYHFVSWNDGNTDNPRNISVTNNATYTASFAIDTYTITATAGAYGSISPNGNITLDYGEDQSFTITPNENYHISSILVDNIEVINDVVNGIYVFENISANHTIEVSFEIDTYIISATANPTEGGTITGTGEYQYGKYAILRATTNPGYTFIIWSENGEVITAINPMLINVVEARTLVANFQINTYTVTVNSNENGNAFGGGTYNYGTEIQIFATADGHYHFTSWNDGNTDNPRTISVTDDTTYTASFAIDQFTISTSANGDGTVSGSGTYDYGTTITLTATANTGSEFISWNDGSSTNPRPHTVVDNASFTANFATENTEMYSITATASNGGSISPSGLVSVEENSDKVFSITPNANYHISSVIVDNNEAINDLVNGVYTFSNVTANHSIDAYFALNQFNITVNSNENGNAFGGGTYNYGTEIQIFATADGHYHFTSWNDGNTDNPRTISVTNNATYTASFAIDRFTISTFANGDGTISGSGTYDYGTAITLTATANTGSEFISWSDGSSVNPRYHTVVDNANFTANFTTENTEMYSITATASNGGSISPNGLVSVEKNSDKVFSITPNANYHISSVIVDNNEAINDLVNGVYTFSNVTANHSIDTYFAPNQFNITVNSNENGNAFGGGTYNYGTEIQIFATADGHYHFTSWNDGNTDNPRTISVTDNATYTASFAIDRFTISTFANGDGTVSGSGTYDYGTSITLTATANTGSEFISWNDGSSVNPRHHAVVANASFTANFTTENTEMYSITATASNGGSIFPSGLVSVEENSDKVFSITPNANYHISSVLVDNNEIINDLVNGVYTFSNVTANHSINAYFAPNQFNITVNSNENGNAFGGGTYNYGTEIQISANANDHYHFTSWNDGNTDNPRTINVTDNATYTASFAIDRFTISTFANGDGTVSGSGTYDYGTAITLTATANTGSEFISWNDGSSTNPRTHTVVANEIITANFATENATIYSITATASNGGTISPNGLVNVEENSDKAFTIIPNIGYKIESVKVDDNEVINELVNNVYSFTNITANHSIDVTFARDKFIIAVNGGENGSVNGGGLFDYGSEIQISASATDHYHFAAWNDGNTDNPRTIFVTNDATYTAIFAIDRFTISTIANGDGTIIGSGTYEYGITIALTATANPGSEFISWNDGSSVNPKSHTVVANENFIANFAAEGSNTYTIAASATNGGTIYPCGIISVEENADKAFTITVDEGYRISSVIIDGSSDVTNELINGIYLFENVNINHQIAVTFEEITNTHTITASAGQNGSIDPEGEVIVNEGDSQSFTITADNNYKIDSVFVDNVNVTENVINGVYTFTNVTTDHTINVTFTPIVGIENIENISFSVYPNPNNGEFFIKLNNVKDQKVTYQLISINGAVIENKSINVINNTIEIFNNDLSAGTYIVRIITNNGVLSREIIVE